LPFCQLLLLVYQLRHFGAQIALLDICIELKSHDFEVGILQILELYLKNGLAAVKGGLVSGEGFKLTDRLEIVLPLPLQQLLL
jgi:hypothetical protein